MKFGQFIEYNMRNIFSWNNVHKRGGKTSPSSFPKSQNWIYIWISNLKFYSINFHCMPNWDLPKYIETKLQTTCF